MPMANQLKRRFEELQAELAVHLGIAARHEHPRAAGDQTELNWLTMLGEHLPTRYSVSSGFVLDSRGRSSQQIDVVIYDRQYTFRIFNRHRQLYVPAESVYAVFEVKQSLNARSLQDAGLKAASVRSLHRTNAPIYHAGGVIGQPKALPWILGGVLCSRSDWRPAFGKAMQKRLGSLAGRRRLDVGCVATAGSFSASEGEGEATFTYSGQTAPLAAFMLTLLRRLQQMGTVPAIELPRYAQVLAP